MDDPKRLLSADGDASELERELLGSVRYVAPGGDEKERTWGGIAARLAAVSVVGTGAATASSTAAASASSTASPSAAAALKAGSGTAGLVGKLALAAVVTGGALGGGYWMKERARAQSATSSTATPRPTTNAEPSVPTTPRALETAPLADEAAAAPEAPPRPTKGTSAKRSAGTAAELLAAESALITQARAELRAGNAGRAELTLDRLRTEFPAGVLTQEREVLSIQLLATRGDRAGARRRAEAFMRAHPKSPHNETLRRLLKEP